MGNYTADNYFYYARKYIRSFEGARKFCLSEFQTNLAQPNTDAEWNAISSLSKVSRTKEFWWIGLRRANSRSNFKWIGGREFLKQTEIRDRGLRQKNCVALKTFPKVRFHALPCNTTAPYVHFICQRRDRVLQAAITTTALTQADPATNPGQITSTSRSLPDSTKVYFSSLPYMAVIFPTALLLLILGLVIVKLYFPKKAARRSSENIPSVPDPSTTNTNVDPIENPYEPVLPTSSEAPNYKVSSSQTAGVNHRLEVRHTTASACIQDMRYSSVDDPSAAYLDEPATVPFSRSAHADRVALEPFYHYVEGSFTGRNAGSDSGNSRLEVHLVYENAYLN